MADQPWALRGSDRQVVALQRPRFDDDPSFGAEDRGVDSDELFALIRGEAVVWFRELELGLAGVNLVFASGGDGVAVASGTVAEIGDPVALVGLAITHVGRRVALISHPLACVGEPVAVVGQACTLVGCAIALVGECLPARHSGLSVAEVGADRGLALISGASRAQDLGGFAFVSGVSELQAGGVLVDQLGVAVERCHPPMPFAGDWIAPRPLVAFRGGAGAGEPPTGVLGEPFCAVGLLVMVVGAQGTHRCPGYSPCVQLSAAWQRARSKL